MTSLLLRAGVCAAWLYPIAGQAQPIENVVVTASPLRGNIFDQSQNVAEVGRDALLAKGGFGLGEALSSISGITQSGFTSGASRPVIRGFDASRVRITENGLGSHDASDIGADHAVPVDPLSATEVEVVRGPATLRYGSQAIGGVVNALNNRIPFDVAQGASGEAFGAVGTADEERVIGGLGDYRDGLFALHADAILRATSDYETPAGTQHNTFTRAKGFALGAAYGQSDAVGFSFGHYQADYGIPTEPGGTEVAHIDLKRNTYGGALRLEKPLPFFSRIDANGSFTDYLHSEIVDGSGIEATFDNEEWEARMEAGHDGFGPVAGGALGIQAARRDFSALGSGADYLLPTRTSTIAGYAFEEFQLAPQWKLDLSARIETAEITGATLAAGPLKRRFSPASFAAGLVFKPREELSVFANLSQTERAPNVTELFAQGPHEASGTYEFGDATLERERSRSVEAGLRYEASNGWRISLSAFRSAFDGFIAGLLTGNSYEEDGTFHADDSAEFQELVFVQRDAVFRGFEADAHVPLANVLDGTFGIDLQADYVRAEFDGGGNLPRIPPLRYGGGVFFESAGAKIKLGALRTEAQNEISGPETPTPGYTFLNASATFQLTQGPGGTTELSLIGSNLTDELGYNHISFTKDYVALPGRSVRLVLRYVN